MCVTNFCLCAHTCISCAAFTAVAVDQLNAVVGSVRVAGVRQALIHVTLAPLTHIARWADTAIATYPVHTASTVKTTWLASLRVNIRGTVIHINFTVNTYIVTKRIEIFIINYYVNNINR